MATVELRNVSKVFGDSVAAVDKVSVSVGDGEFLVLVGPSGCGKSTTLRIVAGLEKPTSGEVYIGGRPVNHVPPKDRDIAMVFQNYALYPHKTAYENMAFALRLKCLERSVIDAAVREAADILGISALLDRKPRELSGGQRQRVAVGRAIVRKPKAFLFDEPLSNLDLKLRVQMRTEFSRIHERLGATMIYVTHDQEEAMTMGDRIAVMRDGRILQLDDPYTLYRHPANLFAARFIGMPPMNVFEGALESRGGVLFFTGRAFNLALPASQREPLGGFTGRRVAMGVRPEHVRVGGGEGKLRGKVGVIQPLGPQKLLHLELGGCDCTARVPAELPAKVGDTLEIAFDPQNICFFDHADGRAIRRRK